MALTAVWYHERELAIALDPAHPSRSLPPVLPRHQRILDVGCGMGQTLLALELDTMVDAYGVDTDEDAIRAGRRLMPANVSLLCAPGERLPFEDHYFDLVYSRLSLPYMDIPAALGEFSRVLKHGGDLWLSLISFRRLLRRMKRVDSVRDALRCGFQFANGTLFHFTGRQLAVRGNRETFQTERGILNALWQAGIPGHVASPEHFIVTATKRW